MKDKIKAIMRRDLMPFPNTQDNLEYTQEDVILIAETFAKEHLKEQLLIQRVSQQSGLLLDYTKQLKKQGTLTSGQDESKLVKKYLSNNCG